MIGMPPSGLTSAIGVPLDGADNGTNGTNYVMTFSENILAGPAPEMFRSDPKQYAVELKAFEAKQKFEAKPQRLAASRKAMAAAVKRMAVAAARLDTQVARDQEPDATAVDLVVGSGTVDVKTILATRRTGRHHPRT